MKIKKWTFMINSLIVATSSLWIRSDSSRIFLVRIIEILFVYLRTSHTKPQHAHKRMFIIHIVTTIPLYILLRAIVNTTFLPHEPATVRTSTCWHVHLQFNINVKYFTNCYTRLRTWIFVFNFILNVYMNI